MGDFVIYLTIYNALSFFNKQQVILALNRSNVAHNGPTIRIQLALVLAQLTIAIYITLFGRYNERHLFVFKLVI